MIKITEDKIQQDCFIWFWNNYPELRKCLFAVPNGGARDGKTGKRLKLTGVVAGVSDLILLYNEKAYCIEMKTPIGKQSIKQKEWQKVVEKQNIDYFLCYSFEEFKNVIKSIVKYK